MNIILNFNLLILLPIYLNASILEDNYLSKAYESYHFKDYNSSKIYIKKIKKISLQSQIALANIEYKEANYKEAIKLYKSIKSKLPKIKQLLYYNIGNSYAKIKEYENAKIYYAKVLQLGDDEDAKNNLKIIALLKDKKDSNLGIAHPKSQNSSSTKSENNQNDKKKNREEDKPTAGSSGDGKSSKKEDMKSKKLLSSKKEEKKHPLSSKVYELINEGYIYEKKPW